MKIIYKQQTDSLFESFGIKNCCLKQLFGENDIKNTTKKMHHHTGYEIHIIEKGTQIYDIEGESYEVKAGQFLFIPPKIKHCAIMSDYVSKISVTFDMEDKSWFGDKKIISEKKDKRICENIKYILTENKNHRFFSRQLIENAVFEIIVIMLRLSGIKENAVVETNEFEDARLIMAKQYIKDNVEFNLNVYDVAAYCYISTKQLTRLFNSYENITPAAFIREQKITYIKKLLEKSELSLGEISRKMNFANEYHFNSFFKKNSGMPPGEYRKMYK